MPADRPAADGAPPREPPPAGRVRLTPEQRAEIAPILARLMAESWRRRHPRPGRSGPAGQREEVADERGG